MRSDLQQEIWGEFQALSFPCLEGDEGEWFSLPEDRVGWDTGQESVRGMLWHSCILILGEPEVNWHQLHTEIKCLCWWNKIIGLLKRCQGGDLYLCSVLGVPQPHLNGVNL